MGVNSTDRIVILDEINRKLAANHTPAVVEKNIKSAVMKKIT